MSETTTPPELEFRTNRNWQTRYRGLTIKITHSEGEMNEGHGAWCYYIYIPEPKCPEFEKLWLDGKVAKITPESSGWVSYDYNETAAADARWHYGVTYYAKHGEVPGFRVVEFGCDYSHLWDQEAGFGSITFECVKFDAIQTADDLVRILNIQP